MHTSTRLQAGDFQFARRQQGQWQPIDFAAFCPDYHPLDRVGVVSPCLEDGVLGAGGAVLALTTAFYDTLRARGGDFFDYPQHFAIVGATAAGVQTGDGPLALNTPKLWDAWSWLDVWPACKWITATPTATALLQRVFDLQINRLFWPRGLHPAADEAPPPAYMQKMLRTHLKQVTLYEPPGQPQSNEADTEVCAGGEGSALVAESIARLPGALSSLAQRRPSEHFRRGDVVEFLMGFRWCD
jgi:hypothetical protein